MIPMLDEPECDECGSPDVIGVIGGDLYYCAAHEDSVESIHGVGFYLASTAPTKLDHELYVHNTSEISQRAERSEDGKMLVLDPREELIDNLSEWVACETCHPGSGQELTEAELADHGVDPDYESFAP